MKKYKKYFHGKLKEFYPDNSTRLLYEIELKFETLNKNITFSRTSKNPMDRRMEVASYFLATLMTLDHEGENFENIRHLCLEIAKEYVRPKNNFQKYLKRLPVLLINTGISNILLRKLNRRLKTQGHPDGFVSRIITDKKETYGLGYGIDILECGICKLFEKHSFIKYAPILCEIDYITSGMAGLKLIRSGTIANGALKCDFRFKKDE